MDTTSSVPVADTMATPRWQHSDEGAARIASYIAPMVTSLSWFGENIDETSITLQHQDLVEFLGTEHDNLSFSHNDLVDVMRRVLNQTREKLPPLSDSEEDDWCDAHSKGIRTLCLHVVQRSKLNQIVVGDNKLLGTNAMSNCSTVIAAGTGSGVEYTYGYDRELDKAWRRLGPHQPLELSTRIFVKRTPKPRQIVAEWADNSQYDVTALTCDCLHRPRQGRKRQLICHWEGMHQASGLPMRISDRKVSSCATYLSLYFAGRPILRIRRRDDIFEGCLAVIKKLAEDFASGAVVRTDLYKLRDQQLLAQGIEIKRKSKNIQKKPASVRPIPAVDGDADSLDVDAQGADDEMLPAIPEVYKKPAAVMKDGAQPTQATKALLPTPVPKTPPTGPAPNTESAAVPKSLSPGVPSHGMDEIIYRPIFEDDGGLGSDLSDDQAVF